jgi:hypothetical protein
VRERLPREPLPSQSRARLEAAIGRLQSRWAARQPGSRCVRYPAITWPRRLWTATCER